MAHLAQPHVTDTKPTNRLPIGPAIARITRSLRWAMQVTRLYRVHGASVLRASLTDPLTR